MFETSVYPPYPDYERGKGMPGRCPQINLIDQDRAISKWIFDQISKIVLLPNVPYENGGWARISIFGGIPGGGQLQKAKTVKRWQD